jgi:hypothetical protein
MTRAATRSFSPLLGLAIGLVSGLATACDAFYAVNGKVENCATRAPIAQATVTLRTDQPKRSNSGETRDDGTFGIGVNELPDYTKPSDLMVSKEGFSDYSVHIQDPRVRQSICLTPLASPSTTAHDP